MNIKEVPAYICTDCGTAFSSKDVAEKCCSTKKCDICGNDLPKKSHYFRCESCRKTARFEKATKIKYSDYKVPMFYDEQSDQYFDSYEDMVEYYENNLCEGEELVLPKYVFGCKENIFKINIENAVESAIEDMYDDFDDIVDLKQLHDFVKEWNQKQTAKSYYQDNNVIIIFD